MKLKFCLYLLLFYLLSACGSGDVGRRNYDLLQGSFRGCLSLASGYSADTFLSFNATRFNQTLYIYSGPSCTGNVIGQESANGYYYLRGINQIDYTFDNGTYVYDIYSLTGNQLRVGYKTISNNGSSQISRPITYSTQVLYRTTYYSPSYPYQNGYVPYY